MNFGEKLRFWGKNEFGTLTKFAEKLGMKLPSMHQYLTGKREPGLKFFIKLKELGCDINWLLSEEEKIYGAVDERSPPYADYNNKIKELEEENRLLRDQLSQIAQLTQAIKYKSKKKRRKHNG